MELNIGDTFVVSYPGHKGTDYLVTDIWPNDVIVMEAKHGVRMLVYPRAQITIQEKVNDEWITVN